MAIILEGAPVVKKLEDELREILPLLPRPPKLAFWWNSSIPEVAAYVRSKKKKAEKFSIQIEEVDIASCVDAREALAIFEQELNRGKVDGVMVERPLGLGLQPDDVLKILTPELDVEGLHPYHLGKLFSGSLERVPPTAGAVMEILDYYRIPLEGRRAVIVGRSMIVGRPLFLLLLHRHCTVTLCHTRTRNLAEITRTAEILVAAAGAPRMITGDMISPDSAVIDVGINYVDGKMVGDVEQETVEPKAAYLTPVPGGVGPVTSIFALRQFVGLCFHRISAHSVS